MIVKGIIGIFAYSVYFSFVSLLSIIVIPMAVIAFPFGKVEALFNGLLYLTFMILVRYFLPLMKISDIESFENREGLFREGAAIVIGNHRSWLDTPVMISTGAGVIPVMKDMYARNPLYRIFVSGSGIVRVDKDVLASVKLAKEASLKILNRGKKLLVFPEGSRSTSSEMLPFQRMAFHLAVETGLPLIPVIQSSNIPFMAKKQPRSFFPMERVKVRVKVLDPIFAQEGESAEKLKRRVEAFMIEAVKEFDNQTNN